MKYKISKYNYTLKKDDDTFLCINLVSKVIFALDREKYGLLLQYSEDLSALEKINPNLLSAAYKLGFIVEEGIDEFNRVSLEHRQQVYSSSLYRLTVMPTLECNFNCWYCYEEHTKGYITSAIKNAIMNYLIKLFSIDKVLEFQLDWFGGEPLLYFDIVYDISKKIKELTSNKKILFSNTITTNGSLITEEMVHKFKEINLTNFQITIDGDEYMHNKIKKSKEDRNEYRILLRNLFLLCDVLDSPNIILRINYTAQTLGEIKKVIKDIPEKYLKKINFTFQQVWQTQNNETIDITSVINEFENAGAIVEKPNLSSHFYRCYADILSQSVITHEGKVFKCTARDFANQAPDGYLREDGFIEWTDIYYERISKTTVDAFEKCKICQFLPACFGPCSQKVIECKSEKDFLKICNCEGYKDTIDSLLMEYHSKML